MAVISEQRYCMLLILQVAWIAISLGCHPRGHGSGSQKGDAPPVRNKRQAPTAPLEHYFARCIGSYPQRRRLDVSTIVDYTIRQTSWFSKTDAQYCPEDTVECWRSLAGNYLQTNSEFLFPTKRCMERYGIDRGRPALTLERIGSGVVQAQSYYSPLKIDILSFEREIRRIPPSDFADNSLRDVRSLVNFFQGDAACTLNFCDCSGILIPPGEVCGQNWYTRLGALTRLDSPIRPLVVAATNAAISRALDAQRTVRRPNPSYPNLLRTLVLANLLEGNSTSNSTSLLAIAYLLG